MVTQRKSYCTWFSRAIKKFSTAWTNPILNVVSPQIFSAFSSKISTFSSKVIFSAAAPYPVDFCWRFFLKGIRIWLADDLWIGLWATLQRNNKFFSFRPLNISSSSTPLGWYYQVGIQSTALLPSIPALRMMMNHYFHNLYQFWPWRKQYRF